MIFTDQPHMHISGGSSAGLVRENNEDHFTYSFYQVSKEDNTPVILAIVADGVGGEKAGEVAASIAVDIIPDQMEAAEISQPLQALEKAILATHHEIVRQAQNDPARHGMACTCACALVIGGRLYTANVGDSRIYVWRKGYLQQISRDHTWVNEARGLGLSDGKVVGSENRMAHVITRYLGSTEPPRVDFGLYLREQEEEKDVLQHQGLELGVGDLVLLCSDGLTDMLTNQEMEKVIREINPKELVEKLTDAALLKGGEDNITLVVIGGCEKNQ